jgi:putative membrane protein
LFHKIQLELINVGVSSKFIDKAAQHYSSLFFLPSLKKAIIGLALLSIFGGGLSTVILFPSLLGIANGFLLGFSLFFTNLFFDYVVSVLVLRRDPIYVLRRTVVLSLFCWVFWSFFTLLGVVLAFFFDLSWWIKLCLLGFSTVLILRSVVLFSTSSLNYKRILAAALIQPFSCTIPFMIYWINTNDMLVFRILPFFIISPAIGVISSFSFVTIIGQIGQRSVGISSISLFRAFLLNWVAGLNTPFEGLLENLGEERDVEVDLLRFDSSKPKAAVIVSSVHPGPFKNIGSSLLPSMLKEAFETKFHCGTCVPLGILGHELDLASQMQNQKIINSIIESAEFNVSGGKATPFIAASEGSATASCQIFGDAALLSFTLAPKTTEDLPQELGRFVRKEAEKHKIKCSTVVNAHNSIDETANMEEALDALQRAAAVCLEKAASLKPLPFEVGVATVTPKEFSLEDGMGPGGITVLAVKVGKQKTAYVVIDGNNMVSGLREKILSDLTSFGFHESEVFTTDTHAVSAISLSRRGYHPVGEVINHEKLIGYVKEAASAAMDDLERCKVGWLRITVPKVKVIGKTRIESLSLLTDKALRKAKKTAFPIFAFSGLVLMLILMIF